MKTENSHTYKDGISSCRWFLALQQRRRPLCTHLSLYRQWVLLHVEGQYLVAAKLVGSKSLHVFIVRNFPLSPPLYEQLFRMATVRTPASAISRLVCSIVPVCVCVVMLARGWGSHTQATLKISRRRLTSIANTFRGLCCTRACSCPFAFLSVAKAGGAQTAT